MRGRRTRTELLAAARTVFERDGFLDARVADIAAAAGASHGTFYTYFDSKTDIFRAVVSDAMNTVYESGAVADTVAVVGPIARIEQANRRFIEVYRKNREMLALFEQVSTFDEEVRALRLAVRDRAVQRVSKSIARLQAEKAANVDLDPYCAASALVTMVNGFVYFWLVMGEEFDEEKVVRTLTDLWASALGLPAPARAENAPAR